MMHARMAALALLDILAVTLLATGHASVMTMLPLHALLTLLALWILHRATPSVAGIAAAAFGPAAMLAAMLCVRHWPARGGRATRIEAAPGPTPGQAADRRLTDRIADDRLHSPDADRILRFTEILRHGDIALRQRVITTVVRNFDPSLSGLIVMALTDTDQSIRTQAAAAVAEIEQELARTRTALEAQAGDRRTAWRLTGLLVDHAVHNRLLSDTNRQAMRAAAIEILERLTATLPPSAPERPAVMRRHAAMLLASRRPAEAVALLAPIIDPHTADAHSLADLLDALIAAHDWRALTALADAAAERAEPLEGVLAERLAYWRPAVAA